jgi:hypothetical protein
MVLVSLTVRLSRSCMYLSLICILSNVCVYKHGNCKTVFVLVERICCNMVLNEFSPEYENIRILFGKSSEGFSQAENECLC